MRNLNITILEGHLTRDAEFKDSQKGNPVLRFSIASNGSGTKRSIDDLGVSFFDVITFSELAQTHMEKLKKGTGVRVVGNLSQMRWKDDSGNNRSKILVIAQNIDFPFKKGKPKFS